MAKPRGDIGPRPAPDNTDAGSVLFVPDVFATSLNWREECVWVSATAIADGHLGKIRSRPDGEDSDVTVGELIDPGTLDALNSALRARDKVKPVRFDWRGGIAAAAAALDEQLRQTRIEAPDTPVSIVGHGLGALAVLSLIAADADWIANLDGGRIVLAAPPLDGSEEILSLATGKGRLFNMLTRLDTSRSATDVLRVFLTMPGMADLLPERALAPDWWDTLALTSPPSALLEEAKQRRDALRNVAAAPTCLVVFGAARETASVEATEDDDLEVRHYDDGDGWMRNPASFEPRGRTWYVAALHECLVADRAGAKAIADLLLTGTTDRAAKSPPEERPGRAALNFDRPEQQDILAALTALDAAALSAEPTTLRVKAAHAGLDRLGIPVAVGHYSGDTIVGAEAFMDRCLEGRLGLRHRLGDYPGPLGTTLVLSAAECNPPGALVIGLGEVGELTAGRLAVGVEKAVLRLALQAIDARRDKGLMDKPYDSLSVGSLLIGTRGGRQLSVRQAVVSTVRGVLAVNRLLAREGLDKQVRVEELIFVELWADIATAAAHAIQRLVTDPKSTDPKSTGPISTDPSLGLLPHETIQPAKTLQVSGGGRSTRPYSTESWSWWRRLIVTEPETQSGRPRALRFVSLGERARAEDRLVSAHRTLVDELLERAPGGISDVADGSVVNALFELLLPVGLKDDIFEGGEVVLVLDRATSRYPWELLARRKGDEIEPLVSRVRLIRQFRASEFREVVLPARSNHALVIGEPRVPGVAPLAAAAAEGRKVWAALKTGGFKGEQSIGEDGDKIVQKLFLSDYRIIHIAAHGVYDADQPEESGVVIGLQANKRPRVLSAAAFRQLRAVPDVVFLNCCHLGKIDQLATERQSTTAADQPLLAASVAEALIGLGVKCVLVAGWAVNDKAGLTFSDVFYAQFLGGMPFGEAVHAARNKVWDNHRHTTTWGAYQCYGDPNFVLRKPPGGGKQRKRSFVSETEVHAAISGIAAKATNTGDSPKELQQVRERLRGIEEELEENRSWKEGGDLLFALAEAWKHAAEPDKAIELYRAALQAWDGRAPIRAAEQLANLLDRYGRGRMDTDTLTELESESDRKNRPLSQAWIEWADRIGGTPERAALLGALLKRSAQTCSARSRRSVLAKSAEAYGRAVEMLAEKEREASDLPSGRARRLPGAYYPGLNAAAVAWAARDADLLQRAQGWLGLSRESARKEQQRFGISLWNRLAESDAGLLEALIAGNLTKSKAEALRKDYSRILQTLGSVHERDSAGRQIDFLIDHAPRRASALVDALEVIKQAFDETPADKED